MAKIMVDFLGDLDTFPRDNTPFGRDGDHCPFCGHDWKQPHDVECQQFRKCQYPPGCEKDSAPSRVLCLEHYKAIYALLGPVKS